MAMFVVSSNFIGNFKLSDNINHNLIIVALLYQHADKDEYDPLMLADFLAHTAFMRGPIQSVQSYGNIAKPSMKRGETGVTHLEFEAGGLSKL